MESHHIDYLGYSPLHLYLKTDCTMCFVFNSGSIKPRWTPDKKVGDYQVNQYTLAKTEIICQKNVGALITIKFT